MSTQRMHFDAPSNPFDAIRSRLAEIDVAFRGLQPQVRLPVDFPSQSTIAGMLAMAFAMPDCMFPLLWINKTLKCLIFLGNILSHLWLLVVSLASSFAVCIQLSLEFMLEFGPACPFRPFLSHLRSCLTVPFPSSLCFCALHSIGLGVDLQHGLCVSLAGTGAVCAHWR